ncbi:MAG: hypothetical protein JNK79_02040 [Chitinophagaceae bacterium]|nr:hypothetical protein [Chitinophagaceae bacterium]
MNFWICLEVVSIVVLLLSFFIGRNVIVGGLVLAVVVGVLAGVISYFITYSFSSAFLILRRIITIGVLGAALLEIIERRSKAAMMKAISKNNRRKD